MSSIELFRCFRLLRAIERAAAAALVDACRVELAAHDGVAEADVLHASAAHQDDRVFLQVVAFAGNVCGDFHAVRKANTGDFSDGRVRFAGSLCRHASAGTALKRRRVEGRTIFERVETARERHCFRAPRFLFAALPRELIYRCHDN